MTDSEKLDLILSRLDQADNRFGQIDNRFDQIDNRFDQIEKDIIDIKLTIENEIRVNIQRVAEGHLDLSRNLHEAMKLDNEKEMLAIRVNALETELRRIKERQDQIA